MDQKVNIKNKLLTFIDTLFKVISYVKKNNRLIVIKDELLHFYYFLIKNSSPDQVYNVLLNIMTKYESVILELNTTLFIKKLSKEYKLSDDFSTSFNEFIIDKNNLTFKEIITIKRNIIKLMELVYLNENKSNTQIKTKLEELDEKIKFII